MTGKLAITPSAFSRHPGAHERRRGSCPRDGRYRVERPMITRKACHSTCSLPHASSTINWHCGWFMR